MPAHLRKIDTPRCRCGKPAVVYLHDTWNALIGPRCKPCGDADLKELNSKP